MANEIYFQSKFYNTPSVSCIVDLTPPTFAGISGATANTDGSLTASWSAATDTTPPVEYLIYIALGSVSAASLFVVGNLVTIAPNNATSKKIFTLADQTTYLVNGSQYTLGVRCKDAVGNVNTNTAIQVISAVASGNLPVVYQTIATNLAATEVLLAQDHVNLAQDHTNIAATEVMLAADAATLQTQVIQLGSDLTQFETDLAELETLNDALALSIAAAGSLNGITMEVVENPQINMEIIDQSEVQ